MEEGHQIVPPGLMADNQEKEVMTTQEKLIRRKQSLIELAEYLQNVSQACKIHGVSRQHFYDIRKPRKSKAWRG